MLRRELFKALALVGLARPARALGFAPRRPFAVPPTMWFENDQGQKWVPTPADLAGGLPTAPAGFVYTWFRDGCAVTETCYDRDGKRVMGGSSTWPGDLALALATRGGYTMHEAVLIAASLCEGCMNVAAHDYGLPWGYARGSEQHRRVGTSCEHCTRAALPDQERT